MEIALITPRPLDTLALPDDLDGRNGANRATGRRQIGADDDLDAIRAWLARVASTKTIFENSCHYAATLIHPDLPRPNACPTTPTTPPLLAVIEADSNG